MQYQIQSWSSNCLLSPSVDAFAAFDRPTVSQTFERVIESVLRPWARSLRQVDPEATVYACLPTQPRQLSDLDVLVFSEAPRSSFKAYLSQLEALRDKGQKVLAEIDRRPAFFCRSESELHICSLAAGLSFLSKDNEIVPIHVLWNSSLTEFIQLQWQVHAGLLARAVLVSESCNPTTNSPNSFQANQMGGELFNAGASSQICSPKQPSAIEKQLWDLERLVAEFVLNERVLPEGENAYRFAFDIRNSLRRNRLCKSPDMDQILAAAVPAQAESLTRSYCPLQRALNGSSNATREELLGFAGDLQSALLQVNKHPQGSRSVPSTQRKRRSANLAHANSVDRQEVSPSGVNHLINYTKQSGPENNWCSLRDLLDSRRDFMDLLFVKMTGREGRREEKDLLLRVMLTVSMGTGHHPPSVHIPRMISSVNKNLGFAITSGLAAGILASGTHHLGAVTGAMEQLQSLTRLALYKPPRLRASFVERHLGAALSAGKIICGFGHPVYHVDSRVPLIEREVNRIYPDSPFLETYTFTKQTLQREKNLQPNIDWALALAYLALGFAPEHGIYVSLIARSLNMLCHILDEQDQTPFAFLNNNVPLESGSSKGTPKRVKRSDKLEQEGRHV